MHLHIVAFNIPYPPTYGGVIDVFYKIKALSESGVIIHLHCFMYGRVQSEELKRYCKSINYYSRSLSFVKQFSVTPFIVGTRDSQSLIDNLNDDEYPVLLEGLHTTFPLHKKRLKSKKVVVRAHNIEHEYYRGLARSETNILKKLFFYIEAVRLKKYEHVLKEASGIASISKLDQEYFKGINGNTTLITPFHPYNYCSSKTGKGNYILIHGDLSVSENIQSVLWLLKNVVIGSKYRFILAGKNPSQKITKQANDIENLEIIKDPSVELMDILVENAQVCLIHSFYPQGFKLKLLHSLYKGRFCLCNSSVVKNTGLESLCTIAETEQDYVSKLSELMETNFERSFIDKRISTLYYFSNQNQARKLIQLIKE